MHSFSLPLSLCLFSYLAFLYNSTFLWSCHIRDNNKLCTADNAFKRPWMSQLNVDYLVLVQPRLIVSTFFSLPFVAFTNLLYKAIDTFFLAKNCSAKCGCLRHCWLEHSVVFKRRITVWIAEHLQLHAIDMNWYELYHIVFLSNRYTERFKFFFLNSKFI